MSVLRKERDSMSDNVIYLKQYREAKAKAQLDVLTKAWVDYLNWLAGFYK